MIRKLLFPALAIAMLGGCVTSGYDYRGGNGDYYYGQPQVEYRDAGYGGYGGYGYPGGWSGSIGYGSGYPYGYYGGGYGYGGYYDPWGYPYGPVIIRQRPPYNGHGHDHDRDHDGDHDHDHDHGHGGDGHHHDGDHAGNGPPPPRRGDDRPPWRDLGNGIRPRLPVGVSRPVPAPPRMVEAPPRPPMPRVVEAPPRPPMPRAGGFQSRDDARPEQDRELRRKTRP